MPLKPGATPANDMGSREWAKWCAEQRTAIDDEATAAEIASASSTVNTQRKFTGRVVWDTTNNRAMRASAALTTSPWHVLDGSVTVTPS